MSPVVSQLENSALPQPADWVLGGGGGTDSGGEILTKWVFAGSLFVREVF